MGSALKRVWHWAEDNPLYAGVGVFVIGLALYFLFFRGRSTSAAGNDYAAYAAAQSAQAQGNAAIQIAGINAGIEGNAIKAHEAEIQSQYATALALGTTQSNNALALGETQSNNDYLTKYAEDTYNYNLGLAQNNRGVAADWQNYNLQNTIAGFNFLTANNPLRIAANYH